MVVAVVQTTERMQQVQHVVGVRNHPGRVLAADDHVEMIQIQLRERLVRSHHLRQGVLSNRNFDQLDVVG